MWEIFVATFNNIVPLFVIVFVGYVLQKRRVAPESLSGSLNSLTFRLLIPCMCVRSMQSIVFNLDYLRLLVYMILSFLISIPLLCVITSKIVARRSQVGVVVQGAFRSNTSSFALPLLISIFGEENDGPMIVMIAMAAVLFNGMSVAVLSRYSDANVSGKLSIPHLAHEMIRNPIILGTLLGLAMRALPFPMPTVLMKPIGDLGSCTAPMTMLAIGLRFRLQRLADNRRPILLCGFLKLIAMPLVWTAGGALLGFRGPILCTAFLMHSCPAASGCVPTAQEMGCDGELAGDLILTQTAASFFTLFGGVYLLRLLALI